MKGKRNTTLQKGSGKKNGVHFTTTEIKKFTADPIEQQMIGRYGLVCPVCSLEMLKRYCPDCGRKTIIPNFCGNCKIECQSQFCENCGTVIFIEGMDLQKYLYLSGNDLERQITKLVTQFTVPSDHQTPMFALVEIVIQVLSEIKKEMSPFSEQIKKMDEKMDGFDSRIFDVKNEMENSAESLNENISHIGMPFKGLDEKMSNIGNKIVEKVDKIKSHLTEIDDRVNGMESTVENIVYIVKDFETNGVYVKFKEIKET